jgi:hypothetical protein
MKGAFVLVAGQTICPGMPNVGLRLVVTDPHFSLEKTLKILVTGDGSKRIPA